MRLALIYTGGTIGSVGTPLGPLSDQAFSQAFAEVMTPVLQRRFSDLEVVGIPFGATTLDSTNLQPSDWVTLARLILQTYDEHDAFVILHGTDTMAFTACALSFLLQNLPKNGISDGALSKPVVITGSQVPLFQQDVPSQPLLLRFDTDAFQNVCGAVAAAGTGIPEVCLFFNDLLLRGNRAVKVSASAFAAFSSPNLPPLGRAGIAFELDRRLERPPPITAAHSLDDPATRERVWGQLKRIASRLPTTSVVPFQAFPAAYRPATETSPGSSLLADLLGAILTRAPQGLVLEAYGEGNFPSGDPSDPRKGAIEEVLRRAHETGTVIIDNTQVLAGTVDALAYAAGSWLPEVGAVGARDMTSIASYTKLLLLLALRDASDGWSLSDVRRLMATDLAGELCDVHRLDARQRSSLRPGASLVALDGTCRLDNDPHCGLVLRDSDGQRLWAPEASGQSIVGATLTLHPDGGLALINRSGTSVWALASRVSAYGAATLLLDGATTAEGLQLYLYDVAARRRVFRFPLQPERSPSTPKSGAT